MEPHDVLLNAIANAARRCPTPAALRSLACARSLAAAAALQAPPAAEPRPRPARPEMPRSLDERPDRLELAPAPSAPLSRPETGAPDPALAWLYDGSFRRTLPVRRQPVTED